MSRSFTDWQGDFLAHYGIKGMKKGVRREWLEERRAQQEQQQARSSINVPRSRQKKVVSEGKGVERKGPVSNGMRAREYGAPHGASIAAEAKKESDTREFAKQLMPKITEMRMDPEKREEQEKKNKKIVQLSVANILGQGILNIIDGTSISSLFTYKPSK